MSVSDAIQEASIDDACGDCSSRDLDLIFQHWTQIAATAWLGFLLHERGVVIISEEIELSFHIGSPCACHEELVATYDPSECVVVGVVRGDHALIYSLQGYPLPEEAAGMVPENLLPFERH